MMSGRGYQALGPLCVLASDNCDAILVGSGHGFPAARGPPLPSSAGPTSEPIRPLSDGESP